MEVIGDHWSLLVLRDILAARLRRPVAAGMLKILVAGGPALWEDSMAELRTVHLAAPRPGDGPPASERMAAANAEASARLES